MAIALVGTIGAVTQGAASAAVTPAWGTSENRTANNLLVCWVTGGAVATLPTTPAGWTIGVQRAGTSCSVTIYYKLAAGADAAPTIAAVTSAIWSVRLGEFSGNATAAPADDSASASGTTSPLTATAGAADVTNASLVVCCDTVYNSATRAVTTWTPAQNNGATFTNVTNSATSTVQSHYGFGYGLNTSNAAADQHTFTYTTTQVTGAAAAFVCFMPPVVVNGTGTGAIAFGGSGTATLTLNPTGTGAISFAGSGTATVQVSSTGTGGITFAGAGAATWNVAGGPPVGGYAAWYDASQITSQADNTALATWPDKSGSGYDLTDATLPANRPTYYSSTTGKTVNGLPAVWYDGVNNKLATSALVQTVSPVDGSWTVFAVVIVNNTQFAFFVNSDSGSGSGVLFTGGSGNGRLAQFLRNNPPSQAIPFMANGTPISASGPSLSLNTVHIAAAWANPTNATVSIDGVSGTPSATGNNLQPFANQVQVGGTLLGAICEVILYPSALSSTDLASVNTYLTTKWVASAVTATGTGAIVFGGSGVATVTTSTTGTGAITFGGAGTGGITVKPAGTGAITFGGTGTATVTTPATGTGAITFAGAGAATVTTTTTGTGAIAFGGAGTATYGVLVTATGTGAIAFGGTGTATYFVPATGTGAIVFAGSGAPKVVLNPTGTGAIAFGGAGTGAITVNPTGTGAIVFAGTGTASFFIPATGTGAITFGGTGSPKVGLSTSGTGAITFGGTGTAAYGSFFPTSGSGAITFGGSGAAQVGISTSGSGAIVFGGTGTATFHVTVNAIGTGAIVFAGAGTARVAVSATGTGAIVFDGAGIVRITAVIATGTGAIVFDGLGAATSTAKGFPTLAEQIAALAGIDASLVGATGYADVMATTRLEPGQDPIVVGVTNMDAVATSRLEPGQDPIVAGVTNLDDVFPQRLEGPTS